MAESYWRDASHLYNGHDRPVLFDYEAHEFRFRDIGSVTYRILPKTEEDLGRVFIELSYPEEGTVTRGTKMRLHEHVDHDLLEECEEPWRMPFFSKSPTVFVHRLVNYEWEDDFYLRCKTDERRIYMEDDDFRRETFAFEEMGDVVYRLLPKHKDTDDAFVELSWVEEEPALWDSIYRLYDVMDHEIF